MPNSYRLVRLSAAIRPSEAGSRKVGPLLLSINGKKYLRLAKNEKINIKGNNAISTTNRARHKSPPDVQTETEQDTAF